MASLSFFSSGISASAFDLEHSTSKNRGRLLSRRSPCLISASRRYRCRASASSSSASNTWITEFDLYELLGVDRSSDQSEIKRAYRALQKRCHPDIAGPAGHDMAILLNEVYSLLSDPTARSAYDQEQVKLSEFQGYSGKPMYSAWHGSETESRAVFVDELKCIGCLKCALFASRTFAIESAYGRARVVAQWADPEEKILDAIQTCPVDCISMVDRSDLPILEFLMSKQPRGGVRISAGNTVATRVSNVFAEVSKFRKRFQEMQDKASNKRSKESDLQKESRFSAIQGIRSISSWWYWKPATTDATATETSLYLTLSYQRPTIHDPNILREVAARRKIKATIDSMSSRRHDEYWTPTLTLPSSAASGSNVPISSSEPFPDVASDDKVKPEIAQGIAERKQSRMSLLVPTAMAIVSAAVVAVNGAGGEMEHGGLHDHVAGDMVLGVVNSFELQIVLAGTTWFIIGLVVQGLLEALRREGLFRR